MDLLTKCVLTRSPSYGSVASYGQGRGRMWLDDVQCFGNESDISDCAFNQNTWGSTDCSHSEDVSVDCRPYRIRLAGTYGSTGKGRVELTYTDSQGISHTGTICDNYFDYNEARVICRMMGYNVTYL